jgi:hypothetical protein
VQSICWKLNYQSLVLIDCHCFHILVIVQKDLILVKLVKKNVVCILKNSIHGIQIVYSYVNLVHVYYQRQKLLGIDHNLCRTEVYNTGCSFKFILKVGAEESIVKAPLVSLQSKNTDNAKSEVRFKQMIRDLQSVFF